LWIDFISVRSFDFSQNIKKFVTPHTPKDFQHVFHQFTLRIPSHRKEFIEYLDRLGIGAAVYYPTLVHQLPPFRAEVKLPESELAAAQVVSIPVHPNLSKKSLKRIVNAIEGFRIE
jgi:dTDP-4-amino-4,6-dideoxygalactose transaminase